MSIEVEKSIRIMIDYLDDQQKDYEGHIDEGCDPESHIYHYVQRILGDEEEYDVFVEKLDRFLNLIEISNCELWGKNRPKYIPDLSKFMDRKDKNDE
tara:strand:+ start:74 stop:364 length:291 start_codon:yes stop_codon:yes gene_type:complete